MTAPLGVALVGGGAIAQMHHLPTLAERPDLFRVVALVDTNADVRAAVAARWHVPFATASVDDALARPDVEAVLVLHGGSHADTTIAALQAGKHVFVEKPLGYSPQEAERVAAVARGARGVLMVGYQKRYAPQWRAAKRAIEGTEDLRFVEVVVLHPDDGDYHAHHALLPPRAPRPPRTEAEEIAAAHRAVGEGAMGALIAQNVDGDFPLAARLATKVCADSLIHDLDLLRDVLGEPEEVLSAHAWHGGLAQHALIRFPRDVRVATSWVSLPGVKQYEERLTFVGPRRRVHVRFFSPYLRHTPPTVTIERMDGTTHVVEQPTTSHDEAFRLELHHFLECARTGRRPETSIDDGVGDARFVAMLGRAFAASARSAAPAP